MKFGFLLSVLMPWVLTAIPGQRDVKKTDCVKLEDFPYLCDN